MGRSDEIKLDEYKLRQRRRRRLVLAAVLVLLLVVLIFTPPLINVNRYSRRITTTMTQSLGRPVHLDRVTLHFLPIPGLTLQNLVVSEDPAFGNEPVIRANRVNATLRLGSLWRKQIEFSTIRFEVDENGSGPSVNLVRNAQGRWNLEAILMQASRVETAPTDQRKAGPRPRFPYIEATDARINVKLENEKMPYSLTETDFALWLPTPQEWRVRLTGKPTRTDSNVQDTGTVRVEGSLKRAETDSGLPVDLHASWRGAQLGEASRLLSGQDAGWRGTAFLELTATGTLAKSAVTSHLQLNDLRRTDLVPLNPLDITIDCAAASDALNGVLSDATCTVPVDNTKPLTLTARTVDVSKPKASPAKATVHQLPLDWVLGWARLFSPMVPNGLVPRGTLDGALDWMPASATWQGKLSAMIPTAVEKKPFSKTDTVETPTVLTFDVDSAPEPGGLSTPPWLKLEPVVLRPAPSSSLTLSGQADNVGYSLQLIGTGTTEQVHGLAKEFPPLSEGMDKIMPVTTNQTETTHNVSLSCSRLWGGTQTCEPLVVPVQARPQRPKRRR